MIVVFQNVSTTGPGTVQQTTAGQGKESQYPESSTNRQTEQQTAGGGRTGKLSPAALGHREHQSTANGEGTEGGGGIKELCQAFSWKGPRGKCFLFSVPASGFHKCRQTLIRGSPPMAKPWQPQSGQSLPSSVPDCLGNIFHFHFLGSPFCFTLGLMGFSRMELFQTSRIILNTQGFKTRIWETFGNSLNKALFGE